MRLPLHIKCEYKERSAPPYLLTLLTSTLYLIPVLPLHISCTYSHISELEECFQWGTDWRMDGYWIRNPHSWSSSSPFPSSWMVCWIDTSSLCRERSFTSSSYSSRPTWRQSGEFQLSAAKCSFGSMWRCQWRVVDKAVSAKRTTMTTTRRTGELIYKTSDASDFNIIDVILLLLIFTPFFVSLPRKSSVFIPENVT